MALSRQVRSFLTDDELRGIPFVGSPRGSHIPGSSPERALLAKEARGKLHLGRRDPIPRPPLEEITLDRRVGRKRKLGRRVVINPR